MISSNYPSFEDHGNIVAIYQGFKSVVGLTTKVYKSYRGEQVSSPEQGTSFVAKCVDGQSSQKTQTLAQQFFGIFNTSPQTMMLKDRARNEIQVTETRDSFNVIHRSGHRGQIDPLYYDQNRTIDLPDGRRLVLFHQAGVPETPQKTFSPQTSNLSDVPDIKFPDSDTSSDRLTGSTSSFEASENASPQTPNLSNASGINLSSTESSNISAESPPEYFANLYPKNNPNETEETVKVYVRDGGGKYIYDSEEIVQK